MSSQLDTKYHILMQKEQKFSKSVAFESIDKPRASAWMIIAPLYLIYWMYRAKKYRHSVDAFAQNFLISKKWALEGAYEMAANNISKKEMMRRFREQASQFGETEELQEYQALEMDILLDHFYKLLTAKGETFAELLRSAYGSRKQFERFVEKLQDAERKIAQAALKNLDELDMESAQEVASNMEEATAKLRKKDAQEIFG